MKASSRQNHFIRNLALTLILLGAGSPTFESLAAQPESAEPASRAEMLENRARVLEADGETERARRLRREAEELRDESAASPRRPESRDEPRRREGDRSRVQRDARRPVDRGQDLAKPERNAEQSEREPRRPQRLAPGNLPETDRSPAFGRKRPDSPGPFERLRHLQVAIDHLHAAGLHEMADRLAEQSRTLREQTTIRPDGPAAPDGPQLQQMRRELQELRRAVRELRARVDKPTRD